MQELTLPADQLKGFRENKDACVIGRKLATEKKLQIGDPMPLKGDAYPVDLNLVIRGIYDGPSDRDLRMCFIRFETFDEAFKRVATSSGSRRSGNARTTGNAGMLFARCKTPAAMPAVCKAIDDMYRNSDYPTRTQTEEAFGKMFEEMLGDMRGMIRMIGLAVVFSLLCVAGNSMAMSMRERTTEVAVLKAIGFKKGLILFLVLTESVLVAGFGGALGPWDARPCATWSTSPGTWPASCRSSTSPGASRPGHGRLAVHRIRQRHLPGPASRQPLGHRRTPEGHLKRHGTPQVQRP